MNLSTLAIKRPVATIMLLLIIVVLGVASVVTIPMDLMPAMELPYALIMTNYPGASPEEVESMVTKTVEGAVASVENLDGLISYSMEGTSIVMIQFNFDTDMNFATLEMRESVSLIEDYLPDECTKPIIMKMDMDMLPIAQIYVSSEKNDLTQLTSILESNVIPRFERASGVASVSMSGAVEDEISVKFSQEALSSYGLNLNAISSILAAENLNLPSGNISKGDTEIIVRSVGKFGSVEEMQNLPLTIGDGSIVRLGDIADVAYGPKEQSSIARINGQDAIGIMISKQSDANTVKTSNSVRRTLNSLEDEYPDINFIVGYDSADFIKSSISSVAQAAILGAVLAIVVVFIFLRNIRATLIIGISIPTSLLAALAIMDYRGITLNLITLCALTICVGMLVDNSIVVLENIFRLRNEIDNPKEAAIKGASQVLLAIVASTLTTAMVFLPIALSEGLASVLFGDFCITIIIALLASLLIAVVIIPMLSSNIMSGRINQTYMRIGKKRYKYTLLNRFATFIEKLAESYGRGIQGILKKRKKFILSCIALFLVSILLIFTVGMEILPEADEGSVSLTAEIPYGMTLAEQDRIMSEIEEYLLERPEVRTISMVTGGLSMMSMSSGNTCSVTIMLSDKSERDISSAEFAEEVENYFAYLTDAKVTAASSSTISGMFGSSDLSIMIKGSDIDRLQDIGYELIGQLENYPGVTSAELDVAEGSPQVEVVIDRNAAAHYGITAAQLGSGLSTAISGTTATRVTVDGTQIDVRISLDDNVTDSIEAMKQIKIMGSYGLAVPVGQIATFEYDNAPSQIFRENQINTVSLNVNVDGTSLRGGATEVKDFVESYPLPDGYYIDSSGSYEQMMDLFGSLIKALIVAIALVFLLLAAQFESVLMSFIVMMAVPFAMSGAFLAMFLTNTALSLTSFLGLIMLVGIVVNNSILLVEFIKQYKDELGLENALVTAGKLRLRPILMSCTTTVVGMIPLSLGFGEGGEVLAPMAISIIGGLIASTVVTLFLIPVIYSIIEERKQYKQNKREEKAMMIKQLEEEWAKEDAHVTL